MMHTPSSSSERRMGREGGKGVGEEGVGPRARIGPGGVGRGRGSMGRRDWRGRWASGAASAAVAALAGRVMEAPRAACWGVNGPSGDAGPAEPAHLHSWLSSQLLLFTAASLHTRFSSQLLLFTAAATGRIPRRPGSSSFPLPAAGSPMAPPRAMVRRGLATRCLSRSR